MRADKFIQIRNRYSSSLESEALKINAELKGVTCHTEVHFPPEEEPQYGYFSMHISCLLTKDEFEGSDNVDLTIEVVDKNDSISINADVCWGHPSGALVAEVFDQNVPVNAENLKTIDHQLPRLVGEMRSAILRAQSET